MRSGFFVRAVSLVILAGLTPFLSVAHKNTNNRSSETAVVSSAATVIVLQPADPVPYGAQKLSSARVAGENAFNGCTYTELLARAKSMAAEADANVIKITDRRARNKANICDELDITFYKADDARRFEKEFSWSKERKLVWDDFRGDVPGGMRDNAAAATYCGIGFETNTVSSEKDRVQVHVYNTFYPVESWVKDDQHKDEILAHEQCHFDICELYTRKLRERIAAANINVRNLKTTLRSIYKDVQDDYRARQQQYEDETEHGTIPEEQHRWQQEISKELAATEQWSG